MPICLSPQGTLHLEEGTAGTLDPRTAKSLGEAAEAGSAVLLFGLATRELETPLPPAGNFWRELGRRYFTRLCHLPDAEAAGAIEPPSAEELGALVDAAPPMTGGEYLRVETLRTLWIALDTFVRSERRSFPGSLPSWLKKAHPLWNLVGRVTFHLAENKRDAGRPFAFLATYTHRVSDQARPQYLPLGRALQEYAGAKNRAALLSLLAPVQRAAEKSSLVRELVDSRRIYHPQAWTSREARRFLQDIPVFEESGLLVRMPAWGKNARPARPAVRVTIGAGKPAGMGLDALLDFHAALTLDGQPLDDAEIENLLCGDEGLALVRGQWVEVDRDKIRLALTYWKRLEKARRDDGITFAEGLRLLAGAPLDSEADDTEEGAVREWTGLQSGEWLERTLSALRDPSLANAAPPGLRATLRPYQHAGVQWLRLAGGLGLGACLADDMGLGKTVQVLGALLHWRQENPDAPPALLVLPASLLGNWISEAARFAPGLRLFAAHPSETPPASLEAAAKDPGDILQRTDLVLTTYSLLLKQDWLHSREWSHIILDEAQAIKNPSARQTKAVKQLRSARRLALTGTPVENSLGDLWSLFDFLNPGLLGRAAEFNRYAKKLSDAPEGFAPLRRLVRPYILRRIKSDKSVIADLPDKTELRALCALSKRQAALYEQAVRDLARKIETVEAIQRRGLILASLMRLKQICNHPAHWTGGGDYDASHSGKFQRLGELAAEIASRQEKVLIFTQFREMTGPLQHYLTGLFHRPGLVLHGGTPVKERRALVADFQREGGPPFFLLSLKAGGTGLTLTEATHVIHFDRWWNPAVENQATDRAYRIGQKKNLLVHKFVCRGTVEEKIDRMIEGKQSLAAELLADGGEIPISEMNNAELLAFVSLDARTALQQD